MRNRCMGFILPLLLAASWAACIPKQSPQGVPPPIDRYRFVFLVDTSGSMMGLGDGKAIIFPKVQAELVRFLRTLPASEVVFVPFHQGPQGERRFRLPDELKQAVAYVQNLKADGQNTWIYRTLMSTLRSTPPREGVATIYYIFTDGVDNDRQGPFRMTDVVQTLRLQQGPYDWVYYIALGASVPEEVRRGLGSLPRTRVQQAGVGEVPTLGAYTFKPTALQLGNLMQSPEARVEVALEAQGQPRPLRLALDDANLQKQGAFLEVSPNRLEAGNHTLTFRLRGQGLREGEYTAWLCLEAAEGTLVRPEAVPLRFAYHPPAAYTLRPENTPERLDLRPGESATLQYRLEGNAWAREPLSLNLEAPKGLEATLNGQEGPVGLKPGERLEVRLTNQGLAPGQSVQPSFQAQAPSGSQLSPLPPLPSVTQPKTLWERLLDYWWLLLPLLLLSAFLLARWLAAQRPWGQGRYFGPPPECAEKALNLKGRFDLGRVDPNLKGVKVYPRGEEVVLELPSSLEAKYENNRQRKMLLESGETFSRGTRIYFYDGQREIASFKVES
ncbi:vWA domain-containing protein [Meiothermus taiwanensis]|uniref:vWA domain-containing protein n=1 Tax=Meiothermus taiwanensis TaxID=172827 RepID=UPI001F52A1A7|nr:vWA domain-containing protein [Meiothermus taiwanensis]